MNPPPEKLSAEEQITMWRYLAIGLRNGLVQASKSDDPRPIIDRTLGKYQIPNND